MYNWAVIKDNIITEYHYEVPENWRHISNLASSRDDLDFMRSVGWFPVQPLVVEFDPTTHEISGHDYRLSGDCVVAHPIIVERIRDLHNTQDTTQDQILMPLAELKAQLDLWESKLSESALEKLAALFVTKDSQIIDRFAKMLRDTILDGLTSPGPEPKNSLADALIHKISEQVLPDVKNTATVMMEHQWQMRYQEWITEHLHRLEIVNLSDMRQNREKILADLINARDRLETLLNIHDPWTPPTDRIEQIRERRNFLLQRSDWSQQPDVQARMDQDTRDRWLRYRQALRDLPQQAVDKPTVEWPVF